MLFRSRRGQRSPHRHEARQSGSSAGQQPASRYPLTSDSCTVLHSAPLRGFCKCKHGDTARGSGVLLRFNHMVVAAKVHAMPLTSTTLQAAEAHWYAGEWSSQRQLPATPSYSSPAWFYSHAAGCRSALVCWGGAVPAAAACHPGSCLPTEPVQLHAFLVTFSFLFHLLSLSSGQQQQLKADG